MSAESREEGLVGVREDPFSETLHFCLNLFAQIAVIDSRFEKVYSYQRVSDVSEEFFPGVCFPRDFKQTVGSLYRIQFDVNERHQVFLDAMPNRHVLVLDWSQLWHALRTSHR